MLVFSLSIKNCLKKMDCENALRKKSINRKQQNTFLIIDHFVKIKFTSTLTSISAAIFSCTTLGILIE